MTLRQQIVHSRNFHNIKQGDLAKKVGISRVTLSRYERGHISIKFDFAFKISKVLGFSLDNLEPNNDNR